MNQIPQSHTIIGATPSALELIEIAGRVCYKSEKNITPDSASSFVRMVSNSGHESVIEHAVLTVRFITNRGVTHELVRHRLASYSQESTRYVNYSKTPRGTITFIRPHWWPTQDSQAAVDPRCKIWLEHMLGAERNYLEMLNLGMKPQDARDLLPIGIKTEIVVTANFREWKHIFKMRCSKAAHPQIRTLMLPLLAQCVEYWPAVFNTVEVV